MTRGQKRKIVIITILVLLLALLGAYYLYYRSTQTLSLDITPNPTDAVDVPQYLYAFNGGEVTERRMQRPVGVLADANSVYVVDSSRHVIDVYNQDGDYQRSFGASDTVIPLNIAKNPTTGEFYVTDRRSRSIHIFSPEGEYLSEFDPKLPKSELPSFETGGVQWAPVALDFHKDGTLYVTEILNGHRLLIFDPDGTFVKSVGTLGQVEDATQGEAAFQFPNGVSVQRDLVYVADSNNRRVKVYEKDGTFKQIIATQGLPRGIDFLAPFPGDTAETSDRFVVADTLAHDGTLWSSKGEKLVSFGEQGVLEGQFSYPNGVSVGQKNKMFIADTANGRVQVWGWPEQVSPVPIPQIPQNWGWCLTPLLLLPLLLLLRKQRFFATADFVLEFVDAGEVDLLPARRRKWLVTAEDYERLKEIKQGDIDLGQLLEVSEYSESDARALQEKYEIDETEAIVMSIAQRSKVFCTQDEELRRMAKVLEIDVVNRIEFVERFTRREASKNAGPSAN